MFKNTLKLVVGLALITGCAHGAHKPAAPDKARGVSALTDTPTAHQHGGKYSYNAVENVYEYTPNEEDIVARHSFILLGNDKKIGYHISFFESRHQHQVIIKMDLVDAKSGKPFDFSKLPKPKNGFISVTVAAGTAFELYTIANGTTKEFPVTFFDGIIGSGKAIATKPTNLKVTQIFHFNRMYASERASSSQYMIFKSNNPKKPTEHIAAHMITGLRDNNEANFEQVLSTTIAGVDVPDGSIITVENPLDTIPLSEQETYKAVFSRLGLDEKAPLPTDIVGITVDTEIHNRPVPIDPGQAAAKKALGL